MKLRTLTLPGTLLVALGLSSLALPPSLNAQERLAGICAKVKMAIPQELALERIGFEATLEVTNNDGEDPLTEFSARLVFIDPTKSPGEPGYDASDLFFVQPPTLADINRIDGAGVIGPAKQAVVQWFIIPKIAAGGTDPIGRGYLIGCELSANIRGEPVPPDALLVIPERITVVPDAQLDIVYFQPQYVTGDDPFTPEVESPIPFSFGVIVRNNGFGPANKLTIRAQQPRIIENLQSLLLVARLLGVSVMDQPLQVNSLTVNLGTIPPGSARKGVWQMTTSLSGIFREFSASYTHSPAFGGEETSVIRSIAAHWMVGEVLNDEPGRDAVLDILADTSRNGQPDTLFESEGPELPVNILQLVSAGVFLGNELPITLTADFEGWGYFRMDDPGAGKLQLRRVTRSDGKVLHPRNAWLETRYTPGRAARDHFLHIFDRVELGSYTYLTEYEPPPLDLDPPVTRIRFSGEATEVGGATYISRDTQIFFTSVDANPVSIQYKINDGDFLPALPFTIREPGTYTVTFFAEDIFKNREVEQQATVVLPGLGPEFDTFTVLSDGLYLHGETLTVRSGEVSLNVSATPNPLPVLAEVAIYEGALAWPRIGGLPLSPNPFADLTLTISGDGVDYYRYRINEGPWSAEAPVTVPLELRGLSGEVALEVAGRPAVGSYNGKSATASWTVLGTAPAWVLTDAPTQPTRGSDLALTVERPGATLYRWRPDNSFFRAEAPLSTPVLFGPLAPGEHTFTLWGQVGGNWDNEDGLPVYRWTIDPDYGSDYSSLRHVRTVGLGNIAGQPAHFAWDGRDESGRLQPPGWYTLLLVLTDPLGNRQHRAHLVNISDLAGEQRLLVAEADNGRHPHARGEWAVWQQRDDGATWQIRSLRIADATAAVLPLTSGSQSQENPQTDGRYAVWQARRLDGNWDIRLADLEQPATIIDITQTPLHNEINPVVDWPWVVYQVQALDQPGQPWQLESFNLLTQERALVYPGQDDQLHPSLHAGRVAWQDFRDAGGGEIYVQYLETGVTLRLTDDLFGQFWPAIRGDWVVWQDNRHGQVELYGYHLEEGRELRLTDGVGNKARPYIEGHWVAFEEDSFAFETANIHLLDIESRRVVPLTYDARNKSRPALAGGQLIWQEGTLGGATAIRSSGLPALQPVFSSSNLVTVTPALVERYGSAFALLADWQAAAGVVAVHRYTQLLPEPVRASASWEDGSAAGDDFPLLAGTSLWVEFPEARVLDLGDRLPVAIDLQAGLNVLSSAALPLDYTAYRAAADIGISKLAAMRLLDAASGFWRSLEVTENGDIIGADFIIPPAAVVFLELREPVSAWQPR